MQGAERTTREQIVSFLREESAAPGEIASEFEITTASALSHVEHIAKSLDGTDEQVLVAPPECPECGFDEFDSLINRPSRCPECKNERISEPIFTVR